METFLQSFGQIAGLIGMVLFALNLILSNRLKILDKIFGGLNNVYIKHRFIGGLTFILLVFHPILLACRFLIASVHDAKLFIVGSVMYPPTLWGILALSLMLVLIVLTFYVRIRYHIWRFSHKFMGVVFILGFIHVVRITSDVSESATLRYYVVIISILGIISWIYNTVLNKFLVRKISYSVDSIIKVSPFISELKLIPNGRKLAYEAGQFAFISLAKKSENLSKEDHPFTMISKPNENSLSFAIKNLGDYTSHLGEIKTGNKILVQGAYGKFSYKNAPSKKQIWIAGGIGITPFVAMARDLSQNSDEGFEINLFYSVVTEEEAVFAEELKKISEDDKRFMLHLSISKKDGYLSADKIIASLKLSSTEIANYDIFICGPLEMMKIITEQFIKIGLNKGRIHSENFSL
ncbi:MAG: ferredoxin reductase family protein [Bacteroidota bacterium]